MLSNSRRPTKLGAGHVALLAATGLAILTGLGCGPRLQPQAAKLLSMETGQRWNDHVLSSGRWTSRDRSYHRW